jgi:hypothetical protein
MSTQLPLPGVAGQGAGYSNPADAIRASIAREIRYLLTISTDASKPFHIRQAGIAHSLGVCLIEDSNMARGAGKGGKPAAAVNMPRFVDVKLTAEQRAAFLVWEKREGDLVTLLQSMADDGYRVGVSWSGEQQAYTVSLTCRAEGDPNNGLCMTSFAKTLSTALWLALYKHLEVTGGRWAGEASGSSEEFG